MVDNSRFAPSFRLSIKSLESELDPRVTHTAMQALRNTISALGGLEQTTFSFFHRPQRSALGKPTPGNAPNPDRSRNLLHLGLQFEAPLDKFSVVLRSVSNWLDRAPQKLFFEVTIPPAHAITLQTNQSKVLAQLLPLGEALLPPQDVYLTQAETYINTFGDLTPAARANLAIVRHRVGLSREAANELNAQAMGPFKTLTEKYQHFRQELLVSKQESDLDDDFWKVMQDKAATMSLPDVDVQFLKTERLQTLRAEAAVARQQAEAKAEAERQRHREQQQRVDNYRQAFEGLVIDTLSSVPPGQDAETFHQSIMANLTAVEFNRGRLTQAREFYHLPQSEVDAVEQTVLNELYLLSDLL